MLYRFLVALFCIFCTDYMDPYQGLLQELSVTNPITIQKIFQVDKKALVNTFLSDKQLTYPTIVTPIEWQELEMDTVLEKLDRTITIFGFWGLRQLARPTSNRELIHERQALVKKIVHDKQYKITLQSLLQDIKNGQDDLLSFWDEKDILQTQSKALYYSFLPWFNDSLNRSRTALETGIVLEPVRRLAGILTGLGMGGITIEITNKFFYNTKFNFMRGIKNGMTGPIVRHNPYPSIFKDGFIEDRMPECVANGSGGDWYVALNHVGFPRALAALATLIYVGHMDVNHLWSLKDNIVGLATVNNIINAMHKRMINIARIMRNIEKLHVSFDKMSSLPALKKQRSKKYNQLMALLSTSTFEKESTLYSRGKVLLAHQLLHDVKHELSSLLAPIAFADAYLSIATLYDDYSQKEDTFNFVEFNNNLTPNIELCDFWTPLMPTSEVVLNSVCWTSHKNKIVLTGPNGGGKSTIMKAIAHAIMLGQSWGIAAAKTCRMSLFTGVRSALNPSENLQEHLSSFMSEKKRIDAITAFIQLKKEHDIFLVIMDEPFKGTVAAEAEHRIVKLGTLLQHEHQCMIILATHLEKPITLEQETNVFSNYQMGFQETRGRFIRTFKILEGPAWWWFKDLEKRMNYIDQLLKQQDFAN